MLCPQRQTHRHPFSPRGDTREPELWIAGGIGITPFLSRARHLAAVATREAEPVDAHLVYRRCDRRRKDGTSRPRTSPCILTRQGVTKHLRVLQRAGIVRAKSVGRESRFTYVPEPLDRARSYLDGVSAQSDDALMRLKAFVES